MPSRRKAEKPSMMKVIMLPGNPGFNQALQSYLEAQYPGEQDFVPVGAKFFANGEAFAQLKSNVRGSHACVVQSSSGSCEESARITPARQSEILEDWRILQESGEGKIQKASQRLLFNLTGIETSRELNPEAVDKFLSRDRQWRSVNDHFMLLLVTLNALKLSAVGTADCAVPFLGYMRQDRKDKPRTPISAKLVADLICKAAGKKLGNIITAELHVPQEQGFFDAPVDNLSSARLIAADIRATMITYGFNSENAAIASPDLGGNNRAEEVAKLVGLPVIACKKHREDGSSQETTHEILVPYGTGFNLTGRTIFQVDDLMDSGNTNRNVARDLKKAGAAYVISYNTHAVLTAKAPTILQDPALDHVVFSNTLPLPSAVTPLVRSGKISVLPIHHLFAEAMRANALPQSHNPKNGSVSGLFAPNIVENLCERAGISLGRNLSGLRVIVS